MRVGGNQRRESLDSCLFSFPCLPASPRGRWMWWLNLAMWLVPSATPPFLSHRSRYFTNGALLSSLKERGVCVTSSPPPSHERVGQVASAWLQDLRALIGLAVEGFLIKMAVHHSRGVFQGTLIVWILPLKSWRWHQRWSRVTRVRSGPHGSLL